MSTRWERVGSEREGGAGRPSPRSHGLFVFKHLGQHLTPNQPQHYLRIVLTTARPRRRSGSTLILATR
jgi:hypothetical protein